jgi:Flp pilus assembly pilin Flp
MREPFRRFWTDETGQDLIEYTFLIAFVCMTFVSFMLSWRESLRGIWNSTYNTLQAGAAAGK